MNFNTFGNLDGGIVSVNSLKEVEEFFVKQFPTSSTRKRNFDGLLGLLEEFKKLNLDQYISKYWIDGSFTSKKENPNDIDLVVLLNALPENMPIINQLLSEDKRRILHELGLNFHCDSYYIVDIDSIPQNEVAARNHFDFETSYWMGKFGFDRNRNPKGIIEILNTEEAKEYAI